MSLLRAKVFPLCCGRLVEGMCHRLGEEFATEVSVAVFSCFCVAAWGCRERHWLPIPGRGRR